MGHLIIDQANMICVMFTKFCSTWSRFNGFYLDRPRLTVWQVSIQGSWLGNPVDDQKFIVFKVISHTHKKRMFFHILMLMFFQTCGAQIQMFWKMYTKIQSQWGPVLVVWTPLTFTVWRRKKERKKKH